jgi:peptidoglycan/LPS O-acetylase OafA/YrhL
LRFLAAFSVILPHLYRGILAGPAGFQRTPGCAWIYQRQLLFVLSGFVLAIA